MFRAFFKNITNLNGEMLGSAEMKVSSGTISDDLLSKPTSTFELVSIPPLIENGNVIGVYDDYGEILFTGIINSIEGQTITASNIKAIFDDVWRYYDPALETTIEDCMEYIFVHDYQNSTDALVSTIFSQFDIVKISQTQGNLGLMQNNYTVNMYDYIMSLYDLYDILIDIYIPPTNGQSEIRIGKPTFNTIKVGNNTNAIKNIQVTKEVQETNRLIVYDSLGLLKGIWYATPSGITQNSSALDRITKVKTDIVFSDLTDLSEIVAEHLSDKMYNHKITCELLAKNSLYDYRDFDLGSNIQVFYDGDYYDSILTGYSYSFDDRGVIDYITLTMGKVRYSLADKLKVQKQEIGQIQNLQNEQVYVKQYVDREIGEVTTTIASIEESTSSITNMLYDTNAPTLTKVYASKNRYFNNSGYSTYMSCSIVPITNPPRAGIDNGARFTYVSTDTSNRSRSLTWYDGAVVPMTAGTTYTMSCYARVSSAITGKFAVLFRYGHDNSWAIRTYTEAYDIVSEDWVKYSWTFTAGATYIDETLGGARVNIGATLFADTTAGEVQLCDFYMQTSDYTIVDLQNGLDGANAQITTLNANVSNISQTAQEIQSQVSATQTTLATDYATKEQLNQSVNSLSTTISQTAQNITLTITDVQEVITAQGSQITTLQTYIQATSRGLEIGRTNDDVKAVLGNSELAFYNNANQKLAWLNSDEGLGASGLSIGSATTANQRWRIFTRQNGSHLTFTRHS